MDYKKISALLALFLIVAACNKNPFTGKKTLALVPNSQILPMAFKEYDEFLGQHQVIKGTAASKMVNDVGQRISAAAKKYLDANGYKGYLKNYKWEYHLVKDDQVNAWCMPGGKIVVYSGIMPVVKNETGLAVVMGHEVAHALANHGQQRMSASQLQQLGAVGLNVALSDNKNRQLFNTAYGVGSQIGVMLPFSRSNETEADDIGLKLMAIAGYNPDEAARLWQRMNAKADGNAPPQILSTHPSNQSRIADLKAKAPEAKALARKFGVTSFQE